ncbi:hypothetical protein PMAYCL1PPCAC_03126, partial [Pristionchus mayeri]
MDLNATSVDGWLIYRINDEVASLSKVSVLIMDFLLLFCLSVSIILALKTYLCIKRTKTLSVKEHSMQLVLLAVASIQTIVPFICVYLPYLFVLNLPFANLGSTAFTDAAPFLHCIFPTLDALVVITMIKPFRVGLVRILRRQ